MKNQALAIAIAAGMAAGLAHAQPTITAVAVATDPVAGVGNITVINNLAVNDSGLWLVEADTDNPDINADEVLLKNGVLLLRENQDLTAPVGATLGSFDSLSVNSAGDISTNLFLDGAVTSGNDSGVFFNDVLVFQESYVSMAAAFSAGTPYIGFFETKINDANQILVIASVDDPAIATTVDRALVRIDYDPVAGTFTETVIVKEGDTLPGMAAPFTDMATAPQNFDFNNNGDAIFIAEAGSVDHVYRNQELLAVEDGESPIAGRTWLSLVSAAVGINNSGEYVHTGQLSGDTATDLVIVKNGTIFKQEGDPAPGVAGFTLTAFGTSRIVDIADNGSVLWFGDWNDPNLDQDTGLFVNDTLILQEGVTTVQTSLGLLTVDTVNSGQDAYAISPNGRYVIAEVVLTDGVTTRQAALLIDLGEPTSCYANCDNSTTEPVLNVADFSCFLTEFAAGNAYANCDNSTTEPVLNVADFSCFLTKFAAGCP